VAIQWARDVGHSLEDAVAASDSFFLFEDGPEVLHEAGIRTIFSTTRNSKKDVTTKKWCEEHGVTLWTLPDAIARGFCAHG
jgi:phosphoribosylaminoimidazolecarboxamide formyltransferase/IMP cyclohydrolase